MAEEILVNVTPQETRVALIENGVVQELAIERARNRGFVGNIYRGVVSRVLPGMGAAFVDVGLARTAFLHVSDIVSNPISRAGPAAPSDLSIQQVLKEGQTVIVQVTKDPLGTKGARLTTRLAIPSRYLVLMPGAFTVGVSQRIENEEERNRLREAILAAEPALRGRGAEEPAPGCAGTAPPCGGGYIVRTAAEGAGADELAGDMHFLARLWQSIRERIGSTSAPGLIYEDLPLVLRTMRDLSGAAVDSIRIDSRETFARVVEFALQFSPTLVDRIEHYPGERPIFDLYGVEDEIQKALQRKVELKSGGHLVLDQTEAMTTIDVNTGGFVGHRTLDETIFKTNLEAAQAIARQLRLRNLGGIIIVDFIDMASTEHQRQVLRALEKYLDRDHAKTAISEITSLGLVQITRKRTRESLEHVLCQACPTCAGRGSVKTAETVCFEILREIMREARQFDAQKLLVVAAREVVDRLLDEESNGVAELEAFIGRPIGFQVEPSYLPEQYDVVLL
ncbi:MAG: ribonuclease E/G [Gammaproteobacteria bacterium]